MVRDRTILFGDERSARRAAATPRGASPVAHALVASNRAIASRIADGDRAPQADVARGEHRRVRMRARARALTATEPARYRRCMKQSKTSPDSNTTTM